MKKNKERAVMVTTEQRGVFFGYATKTAGPTIQLRSARMCVYWSVDLRGVFGLAAVGPSDNCKISMAADVELRNITAVIEVTDDAAKRWEAAPWAK